MEMQKVPPTGRKHLEKERLLVRSNFSYSNSVFKGLVRQTRKNKGLCGRGLNLYQTTIVRKTLLKTLWEKEKILLTQHFSSPTFSTHRKSDFNVQVAVILLSTNAFNTEQSEIFWLVKS